MKWESTTSGEKLPDLLFPITWKTLATIAAGTRDFMPYHHHPELPKQLGMRGPFVNTMFFQGLFSRFATDWAGPEAEVVSASLSMLDQLVPGDCAVVSGRLVSKTEKDQARYIELALCITSDQGRIAESKIILSVPSEEFGPAKAPLLEPAAVPQPSEHTPQAARGVIGKKKVRQGPYPVSEAQIGYWTEMVRDADPRYTSSLFAANSLHRGMIAPASSLIIWGMSPAPQAGINVNYPDVDAPEDAAWPSPASSNLAMEFRMPEVRDVIVRNLTAEFGVALKPGDRVAVSSHISACSPPKTTKLGTGYFVTFVDEYTNQKGEIAGRVQLSIYQYWPSETQSKNDPVAAVTVH